MIYTDSLTLEHSTVKSNSGNYLREDNKTKGGDDNGQVDSKDEQRLKNGGVCLTKESIYKSYDELPLFLNADTVAKTLGIAISSCYELLTEKDFPSITIGNRIVVPKDQFIQWVENKTRRSD